jgi:hypothetical protein
MSKRTWGVVDVSSKDDVEVVVSSTDSLVGEALKSLGKLIVIMITDGWPGFM